LISAIAGGLPLLPQSDFRPEKAIAATPRASRAFRTFLLAPIIYVCVMTQTPSISLRTLGNSDLQITPIGFGAWAIGGGDWQFSWGPQDDNDSIAAIHRALDLGINWIDTAAIYGLGHSEEVVGRAVKSSAHKPYIFTKCSMRWRADRSIYHSLKAASIAEEVEASLKRLGVDTIDLYQIHWPDPDSEIEEGWEALTRLRKQGKIRWIGVSNFSVDQMKRTQKIAPITSLQPPYSMLRRAIEAEILPFAQANGIGVINYSPMLSGLLAGKMTAERAASLAPDDWRRKNVEFSEPRLSRNLRLVELLREIGNGQGVSPGVVAVAWTLHHPAITAAIVGGRSAKQVEETAAALSFRLSQDEYERIDSFLATMQP
jgi:aryl-alcohol dehydrogenase-like predicted oxidoreductase